MEDKHLVYLHPENYRKWSHIVIKFLSQHNALPYARGFTYDIKTSSLIGSILFLYMDYEVLDSLIDLKKFDYYDNWMYLWRHMEIQTFLHSQKIS